MCGIGVVINYKGDKIDMGFLKSMFDEMSGRGTDASGIYFEREEEGRIIRRLYKGPMASKSLWKLIQESEKKDMKKYGDFIKKYRLNGTEKLIMFHTRAKTKGSEEDNANNMPIFSEDYVLIHNGVVDNKQLPEYKYMGEVDSEEILARIQTKGLTDGLAEIKGSMAIAIKPKKENFVYMYRNTNPLDIIYLKDKGLLIACSAKRYVSFEEPQFAETLIKTNVVWLSLPSHNLFKFSINEPAIEAVKEISHTFKDDIPITTRSPRDATAYQYSGTTWGDYND